jgi:mitochondrial fission protein ELM1
LTREGSSAPLRIWALLGARAGDNDQVIALAKALGLPFEIKQLHFNGLRRLGPRLLGASLRSLTRETRRALLSVQPPDLTISVGHRSVPVVRALHQRSRGQLRSIHIGFPRISPDHFDLVISTPQYPIAASPKLLRIPWAITGAANAQIEPTANALDALPAPRALLLVGGPTLYWRISSRAVLRTVDDMLQEAQRSGGSVMVSTSPRTSHRLKEAIGERLGGSDVPSVLTSPGEVPDYSSLLATADSFRVTADSVAMTSDAIWSGKPIALIPIAHSMLGKAVLGVMDRLRPGRPVYPRDLRFFWRGLADLGISETLARPNVATGDLLQMILQRVRRLL